MPMKSLSFLAIISLLALAISLAIASDPTPLQDICVGVNTPADGVYVNGKFCKDPKLATINDFSFSGLQNAQPVNNPTRTGVLLVTADTLPGLNTLGLSFARADFAVNGTIAPHTHPRASEILAVQQGSVLVGFVTEEQSGNRLFTKTLNAGDLILFPQGLIHFASNVGRVPAVAFSALNSQNPGIVFVPNTVFSSNPPIDVNVLSESFNLPPSIIMSLQAYF